MRLCKICGKKDCNIHTFRLSNFKKIKDFSGSSPPEVFIGHYNYPFVFMGILSPVNYGDTELLSSPEKWHSEKLSIPEILGLRNQLIYCRTKGSIKNFNSNITNSLQEVAIASKPLATEFKLKGGLLNKNLENTASIPLIKNAALVEKVRIEENPKVEPKVDYLINDKEVKASEAIIELDKARIKTSDVIKILSAGLLGKISRRKLVPTRWSITAVDDTLSKNRLKEIRYFPIISNIRVFHAEYLGNHYEFILLPENYSFEVIEISLKSSGIWKDYEGFFGRKDYASYVTGAYYSNRVALTEYLEKIKHQASCLVIRQVSQEYTSPLGVGILRQTSREAFSKPPETFLTLSDALESIQTRLKIPIETYTRESKILENYKKQNRLDRWF